jgi:uncharacterized BrkB/YihY/UPF0761 family membrane protein
MTSAASPAERDTLAARSTPAFAVLAKGAAIGTAIALVANLIVFVIGNTGAPLQVVVGSDTEASDLPVGAVIGASIVPLVLGAVGLWLAYRFLPKSFTVWSAVVAVLAVVSIFGPFGLDIDTGSKVALAVMHVATGAAAIVGQSLVRNNTNQGVKS